MGLLDVRYVVQFSPFLPAGQAFVMSDALYGFIAFYRHPSEYALHMARAKWHPDGERCPTWTDSECRCMLGGDS